MSKKKKKRKYNYKYEDFDITDEIKKLIRSKTEESSIVKKDKNNG